MNDNMENPKFSSLSKDISKVNIIISIWRINLTFKNDIYLISIKKSVVLRWEKESSVACCRLYESAFLSQGNTICMFFYIFISFYLMFLLFLSLPSMLENVIPLITQFVLLSLRTEDCNRTPRYTLIDAWFLFLTRLCKMCCAQIWITKWGSYLLFIFTSFSIWYLWG